MKLRLPVAGETSDAIVLIIAAMAIETVGVKKSPRARVAVGAAAYFFMPMAVSHARILGDFGNATEVIRIFDCIAF